jgi:hypothetical protein
LTTIGAGKQASALAKIKFAFRFGIISRHSWRVSIVGKWINFGRGAKIAGALRSQITIGSMNINHFGATNYICVKI